MKPKQYPFYSIKRLINSLIYSIDGLTATFKSEAAFRLELFGMLFFLPAALIVECTTVERVLLIGSLMLVLMVELINTAIEAVVDRISEEKHELSKKAKDVGSAVVLIALLNAAVTWGIILFME
ncbi:MAG: diacylglycerol kinase [Alphaproteobacteria bacterium CG11_big_fil_rev_8_21_14_0_20_39_49]|nr:MAG: diacylglycerol kinase [Alphaproteobacteria bacterium CG11_big_fil_rev_8_21_14_0_20_39_49]